MFSVKVQANLFKHDDELDELLKHSHNVGASSSFVGYVRGHDHAKNLKALFLEHYAGLTEKEILRMINIAKERWDILGCRVVHRVGEIPVGEPIVFVATISSHREAAFHATEFIMDYLKADAPFWKKEIFIDNDEHWVEAKSSDQDRKQRWHE